jgi:acetylornithine deacetylase
VEGIVADLRRDLDPLQTETPGLNYEIEIPPPESFKGRRRLVMSPFDMPIDTYIVQAVARNHEVVTGEPPHAVGAIFPFAYTANDTCHLWDAGIPCLLYGPGVIRGSEGEDDSCVIISEMVQCTKVLALTALEVCNQERG